MNTFTTKNRRGFSLVELLAVVLVLAVLAAVAVPLYTSQRQSAARRTCKANITAIAASLSAYALRNGVYPTTAQTLSVLTTAAEGMTAIPTCPLDGTAYTYTSAGTAVISCTPNGAAGGAHILNGGVVADFSRTLAAPAADALP